MSELIERLRRRNERFQSAMGNYLYYSGGDSILDCDAADALEAKGKLIAELVDGLLLVDRELKDHGYAEIGTLRASVRSLYSKAKRTGIGNE